MRGKLFVAPDAMCSAFNGVDTAIIVLLLRKYIYISDIAVKVANFAKEIMISNLASLLNNSSEYWHVYNSEIFCLKRDLDQMDCRSRSGIGCDSLILFDMC